MRSTTYYSGVRVFQPQQVDSVHQIIEFYSSCGCIVNSCSTCVHTVQANPNPLRQAWRQGSPFNRYGVTAVTRVYVPSISLALAARLVLVV